jgi:hypothetical protein
MGRLASRTGIWILLGVALLLGLALALIDGEGSWTRGWAAYTLLAVFGLVLICVTARLTGAVQKDGDQRILWAAGSVFATRLLFGVLFTLLLPVAGYQDNEATLAGYVFKDAYYRDGQAWGLAASGQPLVRAFSGEYTGDQYGGLLALSAAIYRYLSPDAHRQMLILLLTASVTACGALLLWRAVREWFGADTAVLAAWIFALYPESVFLGSSQMREAFVISGAAMAFCSYVLLQKAHRRWLVGFVAAVGILLFFHPPAALATIAVTVVLWALEPGHKIIGRRSSWLQIGVILGVLGLALVLVYVVWSELPSMRRTNPVAFIADWLRNNFTYQSYLTERASGRMQQLLKEAGERWWPAIITAYGIAQPVLPATIFDPAAPIWQAINIVRAAGWYILAPFLVYSLSVALRAAPEDRRAQMGWLGLFTGLWVVVSALNAGGDLYDNPRYRVMFLGWQALLAAWSWHWARAHSDAWLKRCLLVEAIFVLFFTQWYASRYTRLFNRLPFWEMVSAILVIAVLILAGSWVKDRLIKVKEKV